MSNTPPFQSRRISSNDIAELFSNENFSFFLNGWNEVSDQYSEQAYDAIRDLDRDFATSGIFVATRAHNIPPPIRGATRLKLLPLDDAQRKQFVSQWLSDRASEFLGVIEQNAALDELTRIPLILTAMLQLFSSSIEIPKTKLGVLNGVKKLIEESDEHRDHLNRAPLWSLSDRYLVFLAKELTKSGGVELTEETARELVSMISNDLKASGQISVVPEPADVLMELCSHSLLERSGGVTTSFRFQHQQYQELFAALALMQLLAEALHEADESRFHNLSISYLNLPHWEEAITLIADAIGDASMVFAFGVSATDVGQFLVEKSLSLDPIFSSDLAHRCGASVWERCSAAVGAILRDWHTVENIEHKRLALAGMFASGSDDFIDILQPLLTSEDQQVRLRTYSAYNEIHLTSLGQEWLATVTSWSDEQRSDFIHSIARLDGGDHTALLAHFARTDPVQHIRVEAVRLLIWHGGAYHLEGILGELDDEYFAEAVNTISERESVSPELRQRAIDIFRARFASHSDIDVRLQTALRLLELGDESALGLLKEELERLPQQSVEDRTERLIGAAIDCIRPSDSDFDRIIEGTLWRSHWSKLITNVPIATLRVLVEKGCTQELPRGEREACSELLARVESAELADIIVSRLFELGGLAGEPSVLEGKIEGLLARWFLALVPGLGAESLVNHLSSDLVQSEFEVVISLLGNIPALDYAGAPELADGTRQVLRRYLIDNIDAVLDFEDYSGRIKSMIALALSRVGDLEDLSILERLIRADIERVRSGREARRGGAVGAQANGAAMSFAHWNVEAVIALGAPDTDEVLLSLIREQEYERDAGAGLVRLARPESVEKPFFGQQPRYDDIWAAREGPTEPVSDEDRSALYATAIRQRIAELDDV